MSSKYHIHVTAQEFTLKYLAAYNAQHIGLKNNIKSIKKTNLYNSGFIFKAPIQHYSFLPFLQILHLSSAMVVTVPLLR